jgi:hypothetical protein
MAVCSADLSVANSVTSSPSNGSGVVTMTAAASQRLANE